MVKAKQITIIGAGLSGLTLAYLLGKEGMDVKILEASSRVGGRIQTQSGKRGTPLELGATWFSDQHPNLMSLIEDLGLRRFPQFSEGISLFQTRSFEAPQEFYVPASDSPSYRVAGGTQAIMDALVAHVGMERIALEAPVAKISATADHLDVVTGNDLSIISDAVVACIPPQLLAASITFSPELPASVNKILPTVQTWMSGSVKFTLEFPTPFWRTRQYSGMLYSHAGIITEMYDHTSYEEDKFGFTGFLNPGAAKYSQEVRKELVLRQLEELFGAEIWEADAYYDKVWNDEYIVMGDIPIDRPHQNNGHPVFEQSYFDGRLFFCGTETSPVCGGYMEGAVYAARRTVLSILNMQK